MESQSLPSKALCTEPPRVKENVLGDNASEAVGDEYAPKKMDKNKEEYQESGWLKFPNSQARPHQPCWKSEICQN